MFRLQRNEYVLPNEATLALLLSEPDAYTRSLLLHQDALKELGVRTWAFACLPLRRALTFDLPQAIPVVPIRDPCALPRGSSTILWHDFEAGAPENMTLGLPTTARNEYGRIPRTFRTLPPAHGLALLASTGDSRILSAVTVAAPILGVPVNDIAALARRMIVKVSPNEPIYPNTVILPAWLAKFGETARLVQTQRAVQERLLSDELDHAIARSSS